MLVEGMDLTGIVYIYLQILHMGLGLPDPFCVTYIT